MGTYSHRWYIILHFSCISLCELMNLRDSESFPFHSYHGFHTICLLLHFSSYLSRSRVVRNIGFDNFHPWILITTRFVALCFLILKRLRMVMPRTLPLLCRLQNGFSSIWFGWFSLLGLLWFFYTQLILLVSWSANGLKPQKEPHTGLQVLFFSVFSRWWFMKELTV